jgi:hypothetical protein
VVPPIHRFMQKDKSDPTFKSSYLTMNLTVQPTITMPSEYSEPSHSWKIEAFVITCPFKLLLISHFVPHDICH